MTKGPGKTLKSRIPVIMGCLGILFCILTYRLVKLQMIDYEEYQQKAIEQQTRDTMIKPKRGTIFDRNLKVLAQSATVETVYISPVDIFRNKENPGLIAKGLSEILNLDYNKILELTTKNNYYQTVKKWVEKDEADKVRKFINDNKLKSIHLAEDSKRYYPYGDFASHVLGFITDDNVGVDGIEAIYDKTLTGIPGRIITAKNAGADRICRLNTKSTSTLKTVRE